MMRFIGATSLFVTLMYLLQKPRRVYLVDFKCYQPPAHYRVPFSSLIEHIEVMGHWTTEAIDFQKKVIQRSGIGNETYLPDSMQQLPTDNSLSATMEEVESVLFQIVENLLTEHSVDPRSIDVVITNCSLTSPTPSLASTVVNRFGFRSNVKTFNLSGMGCSAGILAVHLAKDILRVHKNSLALVLSMESVSANFYRGKTKSMLLANCLFRMGGAGILLSNKPSHRLSAKYELAHLVRTHLGANTPAYNCIVQEPDAQGHTGVAGDALKTNMAALGLVVLPYSEQMVYVWRKLGGGGYIYVPDFKKGIDHFCIHAGGRAVIETIEDRLGLKEKDVEASKMTLCRFGNTSSSSTWYSLAYLEAKGRVNRGDKVWQLAFGSGFKCNSAVWKCISKPHISPSNVWFDKIHMYPLQLPQMLYY
ncbi:3-ketoacyl-CoA synthase 7 [Perilla frutescens var. hirtella]|uniref:3-ketoacyl-CoA synthase n=1 Tax=Perilla frutescens var. hirtella TaxID=608512 RepID=A0AAD4J3J7_PERFH|nr:3-ketoacyl-CoA synthase 7 [Perilla frutescens var. hirtella]KAH6805821.1 3-ketoacyl-CoA synthase 7 [Perilla frutescens var. frutescens]KAH6826547.1 3-ketoacyl-CoA synthase 7 [Perilla frutescens var. hirtella]